MFQKAQAQGLLARAGIPSQAMRICATDRRSCLDNFQAEKQARSLIHLVHERFERGVNARRDYRTEVLGPNASRDTETKKKGDDIGGFVQKFILHIYDLCV